jgi:LysM repeat protein/nitrate reductase NapE component
MNEGHTGAASEQELKEAEHRSELVKFAVLAVILVGVIAVVAMIRPFVFGRVVPAVLGEGQPRAVLQENLNEPIKQPDTQDAGAKAGAKAGAGAGANNTGTENTDVQETFVPAVSNDEEPAPAAAPPANPADFPTAVPAQTHVVQPGETLTVIAQRYGVTVAALVQANQIANPNRVDAGVTLIIPEPAP